MDRTRDVVVVAPGLGGGDGVSAVARHAVDALAEGRLEVQAWSLSEPSGRLPSGVWVRGARGSRARLAAWGAALALGPARGRLVLCLHLHLAPVFLPWAARGGRLAVFLHGIEAWRPLGRLRTRALRQASTLLSNSHHTARRFRAANPAFAAADVRACWLGVPRAAPAEAGSAAPGCGPALVVGRLASGEGYKGHDALLEVWPRVQEAVPSARLVVVGDGDDRARLERKALDLRLGGAVEFLGHLSDAQLHAAYRDCGFFAMPSSGEGFGLVFLEAMRAGKACLAGRGAAEEVVVEGETGLIVQPERRAELRSALVALFRDDAARAAMGQAGARRFSEQFTVADFGRRLRAALGLPERSPCTA